VNLSYRLSIFSSLCAQFVASNDVVQQIHNSRGVAAGESQRETIIFQKYQNLRIKINPILGEFRAKVELPRSVGNLQLSCNFMPRPTSLAHDAAAEQIGVSGVEA